MLKIPMNQEVLIVFLKSMILCPKRWRYETIFNGVEIVLDKDIDRTKVQEELFNFLKLRLNK